MDMRFSILLCFGLLLPGCDKSETSADKTSTRETKAEKTPKPEHKATKAKEVEFDPKVLAAAGAQFDQYQTQANQLVTDIKASKPVDGIAQLASQLTATGLKIAPAILAKYPACDAYLKAVIAAASTMHSLPLAEIESGYHKDGKLPKNSQGECYHAKDLIVHPATVVALAKQGLKTDEARASAQEEIVEVLTHVGQLKASLGLKE
jgi:hypothetical protein